MKRTASPRSQSSQSFLESPTPPRWHGDAFPSTSRPTSARVSPPVAGGRLRSLIGFAAALALLGACGGDAPELTTAGRALVRWPLLAVDADRDGEVAASGPDVE